MRLSVRDVFRKYGRANAENEEKMSKSILVEKGGGFDGYGNLLLRRHFLHTLLDECEVEIDVPPELEYIFSE